MQRGIQVRAPPKRDTDTRTPDHAEPLAADATRPPRKQGTKPVMEFNLACCITFEVSGPQRRGAWAVWTRINHTATRHRRHAVAGPLDRGVRPHCSGAKTHCAYAHPHE